ncbi:MAG: hypothetical protein JST50_15980 [Bacteroidetes bacterium]|jgi:hypothetical protein|nr:hypothetical protein [Bacteroidota bacterium]
MGRYKNNIDINILVLFLAAFYFVVAVAHISLIKNSTHGFTKSHVHTNSAFKRKTDIFYSKVDNASLIKLLDKTTVEQKKTFNDFIKFTAECFVSILFILTIWQIKPQSFNISRYGPSLNYKEHYLSMCTLRI